MKVRYKNHFGTWVEGYSTQFNTHSTSEVNVNFEDEADSVFMHTLEVKLPSGEWKSMVQAFKDKDIIPDNYNVRFDIPHSEKEKEQGYNW